MTPKFITPCYVRVDDAEQREKVYKKLKAIGRDLYRTTKSEYIFCFNNFLGVGLASSLYGKGIRGVAGRAELCRDNVIDCGTNAKLFLALAGMRSDTDNRQYYICTKDYIDACDCISCNKGYIKIGDWETCCSNMSHNWRIASAAEIVEHFKQK